MDLKNSTLSVNVCHRMYRGAIDQMNRYMRMDEKELTELEKKHYHFVDSVYVFCSMYDDCKEMNPKGFDPMDNFYIKKLYDIVQEKWHEYVECCEEMKRDKR